MAEITGKTITSKTATKATVASVKPAEKKVAAAKKPAAAKVAVKKAAAPKAAEKKPAAKRTGKAMNVTAEQRYCMIAEAAYFHAERNNFASDPVRDWIDAENEINAMLGGKK